MFITNGVLHLIRARLWLRLFEVGIDRELRPHRLERGAIIYVLGCVIAAFSPFIARGIFLCTDKNTAPAYRYLLGRMCARIPLTAAGVMIVSRRLFP
jgi:hypothetical protein